MILPFVLSVAAGMVFVFLVLYGYRITAWVVRVAVNTVPTRYKPAADPKDEHIQILVLGDIGRSPRMQYHAISVAKHGRKVDIVGFKETARHPDLIGNPQATVYPLTPEPEWIAWGTSPWMISIPYRVIQQFWTLYQTLMYTTPPAQWIIIQNPPSIPTFHVALIVALVRGSKVIIDWHNYGHTVLQGNTLLKPLVPIYKWYEIWFGRVLCDANLCVTDAMNAQLQRKPFFITKPVLTMHDRPAKIFQPIASEKDRLAFLSKLPETRGDAQNIVDGSVRLVVSSTSWTADEDFGMLLDALMAYAAPPADDETEIDPPSPILAIITGRGPQKKAYMDKIEELQSAGRLPGIRILTAWLSNRDYATLLACADLGVSLHKSSSGVDLPMKVVDMFGAGLPVAAYSAFESAKELVKEGQNGCGFETTEELTEVLKRLLGMAGEEELLKLKEGAMKEGTLRWDDEWDRVVGKLIGVVDN